MYTSCTISWGPQCIVACSFFKKYFMLKVFIYLFVYLFIILTQEHFFFIAFREREEGRERNIGVREQHQLVVFLHVPWLGIEPASLTRNQNCNLLVMGQCSSLLSYTDQGLLWNNFRFIESFLKTLPRISICPLTRFVKCSHLNIFVLFHLCTY